jgi:hypothetical protein
MFEKPDIADLRKAAQQLGMNPSDDYLRAVDEIVGPLSRAYGLLDAMPDEVPAVKYPRGEGYRPLWRLVCEDVDQGRAERQACRPAHRAQG